MLEVFFMFSAVVTLFLIVFITVGIAGVGLKAVEKIWPVEEEPSDDEPMNHSSDDRVADLIRAVKKTNASADIRTRSFFR